MLLASVVHDSTEERHGAAEGAECGEEGEAEEQVQELRPQPR